MNRLARPAHRFASSVILAAAFLSGCSVSGTGGSGTSPSPGANVTVSVAGPSVTRLQTTSQFTATVTGSTNQAVTWQVNSVTGGSSTTGTISTAGLYTPPTAMPANTSITISAISQASSTASSSLTESLYNPTPAIGVATATEVGNTLNYTLSVTGSGFVPSSAIMVNGTAVATTYLSASALSASIAVPANTASIAVAIANPNPGAITSSATNVAITQAGAVSVVVSGAGSLRLLSTAQFTAKVTGSANQTVTWQVNGVTGGNSTTGTITAGGLYTAPAVMLSPTSALITAISVASPSASNTVTESLLNPLPVQTSVVATQVGNSLNYLVDVVGTGFVPTSVIKVGGTALATTYISATEIQATAPVVSGTTSISVTTTNPDPGGTTSAPTTATITFYATSLTAAARLLDQTTFGPVASDISHVQTVGINAYLAEQFAQPATALAQIPTSPLPNLCLANNSAYPCAESEWWQTAITAPDQLRQRVAFAMSEMFVVSTQSIPGQSIPSFHNILANDAFGNFETMMKDVTLSPAMGGYLNMLNSAKPVTGQIANENYGRELMQLFTLGLYKLNQDGSVQVDGTGTPVPEYTQAQVQAFARAYTGWTYGNTGGAAVTKFPNTANYIVQMQQYEPQHDTTAKTLLNGTTLPAGQTAAQDLAGALDNIFNDPNVGPFVCTQLIQHLVTSTPSPAYISRISAVFANNGSGVRGDMKAVIKAILTDTEARAGDTNASFDGGHLREPILFITAMMRGLSFTNTDVNGSYFSLSGQSSKLSEEPYRANSVFNFFPPDYVIPDSTINAPEFDIENTATAVLRLSLADSIVNNKIGSFTVDLSATSALGMTAANPANLADTLSMLFMHGQMPASMRSTIINTITPLTSNAQRLRVALYLIITSSQYKVIH